METFDGVMAEHINQVQTNKKKLPHYLRDKIENKLFFLIGTKIKTETITLLNNIRLYSWN